MGVCCSRRLSLRLTCTVELALDEPHPEPVPEQEDAALTEAVKEVSGALAGVRSGVGIQTDPRVDLRLRSASGFQPVALQRPVVREPTPSELTHRRLHIRIVWDFPEHPEWNGVHFSLGLSCWLQVQSHTVVALPDLAAAAAFRRIRSYRCLGCSLQQIYAAYRRENGGLVNPRCFYWS